jgi:hypothetical protein
MAGKCAAAKCSGSAGTQPETHTTDALSRPAFLPDADTSGSAPHAVGAEQIRSLSPRMLLARGEGGGSGDARRSRANYFT